ncbi:MAG: hypothetical protein JRJ86_21690 [Deltaproteobacteria bacterium]|nr:hypothetical protein [Deltaproteobacteria bacterium]MBW2032812.1 hypothetical protein [Deltaproteobacteria bacterium]
MLVKLKEIEHRASNLLHQESPTGHSLNQEYRWILGCVNSIRLHLKALAKNNGALFEIKNLIKKGGEPAFLVKGIQRILDDLQKP